jgi:uncharacterized UPF0160 family protein
MPVIGTHDGKFHADEIFAISMLKMAEDFKNSTIIRSRNIEVLKDCDCIVDVGGEYEPSKFRFDHHQPTFNDTFSPKYKTLLSSAGIVYKHFGQEIITKFCQELNVKLSAADLFLIYDHLYSRFIEPFDAHDNGISAYPSDIRPTFNHSFDIFSQIGLLNPSWNAEESACNPDQIMIQFLKGVQICEDAFKLVLNDEILSWFPARSCLLSSLNDKETLLKDCNLSSPLDPRILVLSKSFPWREHLFELENSNPEMPKILYLIYPGGSIQDPSWRIQCCPIAPDSFQNRLSLPEEWRGLRDAGLDAAIPEAAPGCVFVHRSGFIGAHLTKSGAIKMALKALKQIK